MLDINANRKLSLSPKRIGRFFIHNAISV
ncbi:hypothetical protein AGR6A_Cc80508 [Agrobacterium sp. NCPPB 925]|nr:hypothetical protein AGR6A_Cc80508 [Agrobacterium sp. NCPPB 925]